MKIDLDLLTNDMKHVAADVLSNDTQLKENLRKLEELVTEQGTRDVELREKLRKLEEVVTGQGHDIRGAASAQGAVTTDTYVNDKVAEWRR